MNTQRWLSAVPPTKRAGAIDSGGIHRGVGHWDADQVDERQGETDGQGREAGGASLSVMPWTTRRKTAVSRSSMMIAAAGVAGRRVIAVAVGRESVAGMNPSRPLAIA